MLTVMSWNMNDRLDACGTSRGWRLKNRVAGPPASRGETTPRRAT